MDASREAGIDHVRRADLIVRRNAVGPVFELSFTAASDEVIGHRANRRLRTVKRELAWRQPAAIEIGELRAITVVRE